MIHHGDCLEVLKSLDADSVDALVTDPPYFLTNDGGSGFMGKEWDSLSPANAVAESYFRSARLDLSTVEDDAVPAPASTQRTRKSSARASSFSALPAERASSALQVSESPLTRSAPALVITKAEALALCSEWCRDLTSLVAKLPSHARFVAPPSFTGTSTRRSIARTVADILSGEPAWLESVTAFTSTARAASGKSSLEAKTGTSSESKFISAITGPASGASVSATDNRSSVTTSSRSEYQATISRITSLPFVKAAIRECTKSPSFIPILSEVFHLRWAREVYRVLKPGAHGLAFNGSRTYHRMAAALEDAGFEIRDTVYWLHGQGFPKSLNVAKAGAGKEWEGWGTALKPAAEPIALIRKPLSEKTVAANVLRWGCGALNIDGSRIEAADQDKLAKNWDRESMTDIRGGKYNAGKPSGIKNTASAPTGRFPSHLLLSCSPHCTPDTHDLECAIAELDRQSLAGGMHSAGAATNRKVKTSKHSGVEFLSSDGAERNITRIGDSGGASRFFYCAKVSSSERSAGLSGGVDGHAIPVQTGHGARPKSKLEAPKREAGIKPGPLNTHPTVKPQKLMRYLCRMVTPPGGTVLDPFTGSGSTGVAAISEGLKFVGIEREQEYVEIAKRRIYHRLPEFKKQVKR